MKQNKTIEQRLLEAVSQSGYLVEILSHFSGLEKEKAMYALNELVENGKVLKKPIGIYYFYSINNQTT